MTPGIDSSAAFIAACRAAPRETVHAISSTAAVSVPDSTIRIPPLGSLASNGEVAPGSIVMRTTITSDELGSDKPGRKPSGSNVTPCCSPGPLAGVASWARTELDPIPTRLRNNTSASENTWDHRRISNPPVLPAAGTTPAKCAVSSHDLGQPLLSTTRCGPDLELAS